MREKLLWGVIVILVVAIIFIVFIQGKSDNDIARIEKRIINHQEFVDQLVQRYGTQLLREMIEHEAISYEANRLAIEVTDREIDKEIEKYRHNISENEIDFEQLREDIRYNLLLEKLATLDVRVSEA